MKVGKLSVIGVIAGIILAGCMKLIFVFTGNEAYQLLYNVDYIPLIHVYDDSAYFGIVFHYAFCIISVIGLYYFLKFFRHQDSLSLYVILYTVGAGVLFFLTLLTNDPPSANLLITWLYWTVSHILFGVIVGVLVKKWC